jgi:hypothetical protein
MAAAAAATPEAAPPPARRGGAKKERIPAAARVRALTPTQEEMEQIEADEMLALASLQKVRWKGRMKRKCVCVCAH